MKTLIEYAKSFIGTPYIYGGSSPIKGFDCSEFCLELLKSVGIAPKADTTARGIYTYLLMTGLRAQKGAGAFAFFGKNTDEISHVAFMINDNQMIEMGGGTRETTTQEKADAMRAFCRIRPISNRNDLVAVIIPNYPEWVLTDAK